MNPYSLSEIVEQAVQTEKLGKEYYDAMSGKFSDKEVLCKLFNALADQELQHERKLSDLKSALKDEQIENPDEVSRYLHAIVESEFFLGSDKALTAMDQIATVDEAIRYAIRFEKETLLYYHTLKDIVKEKDIMDVIIKEEKKHILWLSQYRGN